MSEQEIIEIAAKYKKTILVTGVGTTEDLEVQRKWNLLRKIVEARAELSPGCTWQSLDQIIEEYRKLTKLEKMLVGLCDHK